MSNLFIFIYALLLFLYSQHKALTSVYWIADDFPQHLLWLNKFHLNFFQPNDYYLQVSEAIQPWGIYIVNSVLGYFVSPVILSKVLPLVALWIGCWFSFFIFKKRFGWVVAITAMVVLSVTPFERAVGFFARAYGFPFLLAFTYYWLEENRRAILLMLLLSTLFYPVVFLVECVIIALDSFLKLMNRKLKEERSWQLGVYAMIGICCGLLLIKSYTVDTSDLLGGFLSKKELLELPEFQSGGRVGFQNNMDALYPLKFRWASNFKFLFSDYDSYIVPALLLILIALVISKKSRYPKLDLYIISLVFAGTFLYYLAQWRLPQLFLPRRYIYYSYIPFLFFLLIRSGTLIQVLFQQSKVINIAIAGLLIAGTFYGQPVENMGLSNCNEHHLLYEKINTFDEPVMIAGPPTICSQIPTFCRQSVLFSHEAAHAIYFRNYYDHVKVRLEDFIDAYGSTKVDTLTAFIEKYDIDYLVLDKKFLVNKYLWFYEPYKSKMDEKMSKFEAVDLALLKIPQQFIIEADERYDLVDCEKWIQELEHAK